MATKSIINIKKIKGHYNFLAKKDNVSNPLLLNTLELSLARGVDGTNLNLKNDAQFGQ